MSEKSRNKFEKLFDLLLKQQIPFVACKFQRGTAIQVFIQAESFPEKLRSLEDLGNKRGFVVSPFHLSSHHPVVFMQPDLILTGENINNDIFSYLSGNKRFVNISQEKNICQTTSQEEFISNIEKIISGIELHQFQKVVLSKIQVNPIPKKFDKSVFFLKLCEKYPSAMVYLLQIPEVGCWAGATPESLLISTDKFAKTMSIAGTQKSTGKAIDAYRWGEKEIEEQNFVTDFVENTLRKAGIRDNTKVGPVNLQAGNLIHLQTKFKFEVLEYQNRVGSLVSALHPTPATGGVPKERSIDFLLKNEKHDRSYYAGFLGTVDINNATNLFVNLRCVRFFEDEYVLYSGAGITSSSIADDEWEETENKMETMKAVILG
ncbi:MAG: chorismate-binding protein [Paludibacteraceae bacterium]